MVATCQTHCSHTIVFFVCALTDYSAQEPADCSELAP